MLPSPFSPSRRNYTVPLLIYFMKPCDPPGLYVNIDLPKGWV